MSETIVNHRPFDLTQARQGAPVGVRRPRANGSSVRIICLDREHDRPIVALLRERADIKGEAMLAFYPDGHFEESRSEHWVDLVMTPVGNVDGTPVFWGDKIYHKRTGTLEVLSRKWPGLGGEQIFREYAMEPQGIKFKGRPLSIRDKLWYKGPKDDSWNEVTMCGQWTNITAMGIDTTHYSRIKNDLAYPHLLECYSWDKPK